jgi:hypothetical protein
MDIVPDEIRRGAERRIGRIYGLLTSGDPEHIRIGRQVVAIYLNSHLHWTTLDLVDRVKTWINQPRDRLDAKERRFFNALLRDGSAAGNGAGADWVLRGRAARVMFYCGRFKTAWEWFEETFALIDQATNGGGVGALPQDQQEAGWDIFAARAEFRAYLGDPQVAHDDLLTIPAAKAWHKWVRAFALHQMAYLERRPFAQDPTDGLPDDAAGKEPRYHESNALIDEILRDGELAGDERYDIELLKVANWGGIWRRREHDGGDVGEAQREAQNAKSRFEGAPFPSSNQFWTWEKEKRGRLPHFYRRLIDEQYPKQAVLDWRDAYQRCYKKNLLQGGIPLRAPSSAPDDERDGWTDLTDDHSDDP